MQKESDAAKRHWHRLCRETQTKSLAFSLHCLSSMTICAAMTLTCNKFVNSGVRNAERASRLYYMQNLPRNLCPES